MGKRKGHRGVRGLRSALEEFGGKALFFLSHPLPHCCPRACGWGREPSRALPLHALLPALFVFLLGDPHLLESALRAGNDIGSEMWVYFWAILLR